MNRWLKPIIGTVIVRPDRYFFGTGEPGDLVDSFYQVIRTVPLAVAN